MTPLPPSPPFPWKRSGSCPRGRRGGKGKGVWVIVQPDMRWGRESSGRLADHLTACSAQVLFPYLGKKPWQRRGIGGFLVALASATASARGCPTAHYLQSAPLFASFYHRRGFSSLAFPSWPPSLRALVADRTDCCPLVLRSHEPGAAASSAARTTASVC